VAGSSFLYAHPVGRYGWAVAQASLCTCCSYTSPTNGSSRGARTARTVERNKRLLRRRVRCSPTSDRS
jgi:hypothetical protein